MTNYQNSNILPHKNKKKNWRTEARIRKGGYNLPHTRKWQRRELTSSFPFPILTIGLETIVVDRTTHHFARSCFLCRLRHHRQREPEQQLCHGNYATGSSMLLRLPNCHQKYSQRDIFAPHRHVRQGSCKETTPPTSDRNSTMRSAEWALTWCGPTVASSAERMIAFAAVDGIFFLDSFCAIFWLKK